MSDRPVSRFVSFHVAQMSSHLQQCTLARGSLHYLGCAAEAAHAFLAQRFVTLLFVLVAVLATVAGW